MPHQQHYRDNSRRQQRGRNRQRADIDVLRLLERQQRGPHEHGEQDEAARVGSPMMRFGRRVPRQPRGQCHRAEPDRHVD